MPRTQKTTRSRKVQEGGFIPLPLIAALSALGTALAMPSAEEGGKRLKKAVFGSGTRPAGSKSKQRGGTMTKKK